MNWKQIMFIYRKRGPEAAKQTLEALPMKILKNLAKNRCIIQPCDYHAYTGLERKPALVAKIYPYIAQDIEAEDNPSEEMLQRKFLKVELNTLLQRFKHEFPNATQNDFWYLVQNIMPVERWNGGFERVSNRKPKEPKVKQTNESEDELKQQYTPVPKHHYPTAKKVLYLL